MFALVTPERNSNVPVSSRGLPFDGDTSGFNREQVPCCQGLRYYRACSEVQSWAFSCHHCTHGAASCVQGCVEHASLCCTCVSSLHTQSCIERTGLYCTCMFALHIWGCFSHVGLHCMNRKLLHFILRHFEWAPG